MSFLNHDKFANLDQCFKMPFIVAPRLSLLGFGSCLLLLLPYVSQFLNTAGTLSATGRDMLISVLFNPMAPDWMPCNKKGSALVISFTLQYPP